MTFDNDYESWRRARRHANVPDGFADRVMTALEQSQQHVRLRLLRRLLLAGLTHRVAKAGLCLVAAAVCILRVVLLFAIFQV